MNAVSNSSNQRLIVQLCGSWFDDVESGELVRCPRLWTDAAGQMWVAVGDEPGQRVQTVEYIDCLAKVVIVADEVFIVERVDYHTALDVL